MKKLSTLFFSFLISTNITAQHKKTDTLRAALAKNSLQDTNRLNALKILSIKYWYSQADSSAIFGWQYYRLAVKFNKIDDQETALNIIAGAYFSLGDYAQCLSLYIKVIKLADSVKSVPAIVAAYNNIGFVYCANKDYSKSLSYFQLGLRKWDVYSQTHRLKTWWEKELKANLFINTAELFMDMRKFDLADRYLQLSFSDCKKNNFRDILCCVERDLGEVETAKGHKDAALKYYRGAASVSIMNDDVNELSLTYLSNAGLYHVYRQTDSAEYYAKKALDVASTGKYLQDVLNAGKALYTYYKEGNNLPQAFKYLELTTTIKDSLYSQEKIKKILSIDFAERENRRDIENAREKEQERVRVYLLILGMAIFLFVAFMGWRESRQRAKANRKLQKQQLELDAVNQNLELIVYERTKDLEDTNAKLFDYSYYLSHQIRGPVSTMKGLVNLEKEGLVEYTDFVKMTSACLSDIDNKISEINNVLNKNLK